MSGAEGEALRDGRYAILRVLGEGAQGDTLEAIDKRLGKLVAIKRFRIRGAANWKSVELAEREARVLASLSHPSLPAYLDHFEEGGALFLVMEKIEGESLGAMRRRRASLGPEEIVRFLRDASDILDYLHSRAPPVIHRDIKPNNVIRRPDGSFAIVDFGAVRDRMRPEGGSTVVGTFGYMAPEQFQGRALPASDVYAVGATAICLLTGEEPEALPHRGLAIDVPAALHGRADPRLVRVLSAMLEPDPDRRAPRIAPLLEGLGPAGAHRERASSGPAAGERDARGARRAERRAHGAAWEAHEAEWAVERLAREAERGAERLAREAERRAERLARRAEKRARRAERHARRWGEHRAAPWRGLDGPPLVLALLGLTIARVAVGFALGVFVPTLLTVLSIVFGRVLRENAAPSVREAGRAADRALARAMQVVRGKPALDDAARREDAQREGVEATTGARIDARETGARVRIGDDEIETAAEAEADEAVREARRTRR